MANILLVFTPQTEHRQSTLCKSEIIPGDWLSRKVKQLPKEAFKLEKKKEEEKEETKCCNITTLKRDFLSRKRCKKALHPSGKYQSEAKSIINTRQFYNLGTFWVTSVLL